MTSDDCKEIASTICQLQTELDIRSTRLEELMKDVKAFDADPTKAMHSLALYPNSDHSNFLSSFTDSDMYSLAVDVDEWIKDHSSSEGSEEE